MPMSRRKFATAVGGTVAALVTGPTLLGDSAQATTSPLGLKAAQPSGPYETAFLTLYNKIKSPASGYFSPQGVPYHAVETLIVEAPDYGHETTSEAFSYWMWLEAAYGRVTGDWAPFNNAWAAAERFIIPTQTDQPTNSGYNPSAPATYIAEHPSPTSYPSPLNASAAVGQDPIAGELQSAYGSPTIYQMHWLMDVDNTYGYGNTPGTGTEAGPSAPGPSYINSYQRGSQESVWETIPQPTTDQFRYGGPNGYLDLFVDDASYAQQWKYTSAPDADARAIQATYWAVQWATEQGNAGAISASAQRAAKMGDYLRYAMFDKYFKQIGNCVGATSCPAGSGRSSQHYLLSWYMAWGGALAGQGNWAWRIGDGAAHHGYQNPMAAYALTNVASLAPRGSTARTDWTTSLQRQLEFLQWLQSAEGAIAGGATNSWDGQYGTPPSGLPTFYGMFYDWQPVYHDPPSNNWFGMQAWGMERWAEYYFVTGNAAVKAVLDKWVAWVLPEITVGANWQIPSTLNWTGQPGGNWTSGTTSVNNSNLHVSVVEYGQDVGVASALAKTLTYYAARANHAQARTTAQGLLDALVAESDDLGVGTVETRADYNRFDDPVFVPSGWTGTMPNGDPINSSSTFLSIRSWYQDDPEWSKVQDYLDGGPAPTFTYHRFWAQAGVAIALAVYGELFPS